MTDTAPRRTDETEAGGFLSGQKLDERGGVVGDTADDVPGFDHLSGDADVRGPDRVDVDDEAGTRTARP